MKKGYDRVKLFEDAKRHIEEKNLFFITDVVAFLPCERKRFYVYWPVGSPEHTEITEMLERNRIKTKAAIRAKLFKSEKAAELIALYRLLSTPEEHMKLNQQYIEMKGKVESVNINIDLEKNLERLSGIIEQRLLNKKNDEQLEV